MGELVGCSDESVPRHLDAEADAVREAARQDANETARRMHDERLIPVELLALNW
jgi:hypothetical protein